MSGPIQPEQLTDLVHGAFEMVLLMAVPLVAAAVVAALAAALIARLIGLQDPAVALVLRAVAVALVVVTLAAGWFEEFQGLARGALGELANLGRPGSAVGSP